MWQREKMKKILKKIYKYKTQNNYRKESTILMRDQGKV